MDELNCPHLPPLRFVACLVQEIVCFNAKHLTTISTDARCCGAACPAEAGCLSLSSTQEILGFLCNHSQAVPAPADSLPAAGCCLGEPK